MDKTPLFLIHKAICQYLGIELDQLFVKGRVKENVLKRQWFYYFARKLNPEHIVSSSKIGKYYDQKYDHATVLHAVKKIQGFIDLYKEDAIRYYEIKMIINDLTDYENFEMEFCVDYPIEFMVRR